MSFVSKILKMWLGILIFVPGFLLASSLLSNYDLSRLSAEFFLQSDFIIAVALMLIGAIVFTIGLLCLIKLLLTKHSGTVSYGIVLDNIRREADRNSEYSDLYVSILEEGDFTEVYKDISFFGYDPGTFLRLKYRGKYFYILEQMDPEDVPPRAVSRLNSALQRYKVEKSSD